ncbi:response regulator [Jiella sp. M17.18]|uniref:response regulator n=1 Tax=Jiella sp. M17.18 TaxID=3234247 RepID=UPI0034DF461C
MSNTHPVVLLVEDDPLVRMVMSDTLTDAGFRVLEAGSADTALVLLEARNGIVAIATDVDMPGPINGFTLARLVRRSWPSVGIVVASGARRPQGAELPAGAIFLPKPFLPPALVAAVESVIARPISEAGHADPRLPFADAPSKSLAGGFPEATREPSKD